MNQGTLIPRPEHTDLDSVPGMLLMMASLAEEALQTAGAEAGEDYTYMDLFRLAQPLALSEFERSGKVPVPEMPRNPN